MIKAMRLKGKLIGIIEDKNGFTFYKNGKAMNVQDRLDREIELIEKDDSLSDEEKRKEIQELYREAREIEREENERS